MWCGSTKYTNTAKVSCRTALQRSVGRIRPVNSFFWVFSTHCKAVWDLLIWRMIWQNIPLSPLWFGDKKRKESEKISKNMGKVKKWRWDWQSPILALPSLSKKEEEATKHTDTAYICSISGSSQVNFFFFILFNTFMSFLSQAIFIMKAKIQKHSLGQKNILVTKKYLFPIQRKAIQIFWAQTFTTQSLPDSNFFKLIVPG